MAGVWAGVNKAEDRGFEKAVKVLIRLFALVAITATAPCQGTFNFCYAFAALGTVAETGGVAWGDGFG